MLPPLEEWSAKIWLVTHMDLHRTAKVQSFVRHLKSEVMTWPVDTRGASEGRHALHSPARSTARCPDRCGREAGRGIWRCWLSRR
jgi:hypothetical protein